jgi:hypothetical protein
MIRHGLILCALFALSGCVSDERPSAARDPIPAPWPTADAPDALRSLSDDLLAYQVAAGRMPDTLAQLDRSGMATAGPYGATGYAYSPICLLYTSPSPRDH